MKFPSLRKKAHKRKPLISCHFFPKNKTIEFSLAGWLLSSYIATGIENVPIFIKTDNAEKQIEKHLPNNKIEIINQSSYQNFKFPTQ